MYSVKIKNNIQNLFCVLDNTVPGSSPYAINKTVSNSDNNFTVNVSQSGITPVTISLVQSPFTDRYTIGTTIPVGTFRCVRLYSSGNVIRRQIVNTSISGGSVVNSLPVTSSTTGYNSYNHPDSSVYYGTLNSSVLNLPVAITMYDTNVIASASDFICTQIGVIFLAYNSYTGTGLSSTSTLINVGETLSSVLNSLILGIDGTTPGNRPFLGFVVDEITTLQDGIVDATNSNTGNSSGLGFAVVYTTAIFSIN